MAIQPFHPSAKIQGTQGSLSYDQYLQKLDQLLKRNTGTGVSIGQDVSSNIPMYLPGRVKNPSGLNETPSTMMMGNGMQQPEPIDRSFQPLISPQDQGEEQQPLTIQDFFSQIAQQQTRSELPPLDELEQNFQRYGIDYGVASMPDGRVQMRSGAVQDGVSTPVPVASMADGTVGWSDGYQRQSNTAALSYLRGAPALSQAIFGRQQQVTQPYGNVNPIEPTPGNINYGTDFRTRDLTQPLSNIMGVPLKVIQVIHDDGIKDPYRSVTQGYGNSVLVQLPSGETLRLSHLADMGNFQEGMVIQPGEFIGTPGQTGNADGQHLDVEYRDAHGQIKNPSSFSLGSTQQPGKPIAYDPNMNTALLGKQQLQPQPNQLQLSQQPMQIQTPVTDAISNMVQVPQNALKTAGQLLPQAASTINSANPTGNFDLGITETLQGKPQAAATAQRNTISNVGTALNAPDLNTKALSSTQGTNPFRQLAGNLVDTASTPFKKFGLPDTGISEAIAGGKTTNTGLNLVPQTYASDGSIPNMSKVPTSQDYAGVLGQNLKEAGSSVGQTLNQAGQGIQGLANAGASSLQNIFKSQQQKAPLAVGDVSGVTTDAIPSGQFSSLMDTAGSRLGNVKNDVRDSFFKMGGAQLYKNFLNPGAIDNSGGALSLNLFNDNFFKDLGNIVSVFGGTKDFQPAVDKYIQNEAQKYPKLSTINYSDGYDRGEVDAYNKQVTDYNNSLSNYFNQIKNSVSGAVSSFTPSLARSAKNVFSGSQIPPAASMATPNASMAPMTSMVKPSANFSAPQQKTSTPNFSPVNAPNTNTPSGPVYIPPPKAATYSTVPAKPAFNYSPVSPKAAPAPTKNYSPAPQSKQPSNVFTKVISALKNIFRF